MPAGWNDWYHCVASTYGSWLHGDPRGFRTRHHRQHIEGDYKNPPPPGKYDKALERSRRRIKRPPVIIPPAARPIILDELLEQLIARNIERLTACVSGQHMHVLARFPEARTWHMKPHRLRTSAKDDPIRHILGIAKRQASRRVIHEKLMTGAIWAKRCKIKPVKDRAHQLNVFYYILDHTHEGAAVWHFKM